MVALLAGGGSAARGRGSMTWDWGRYDWGLLLGGGFELIDFFATGLRAAPQYGFGLRRRNNELNELTNCRAARGRRGELIEFLQRGCGLHRSSMLASDGVTTN